MIFRNFRNLHRVQESGYSALRKCSPPPSARKFVPVDLFRVSIFCRILKKSAKIFETLSETILLETLVKHWNISPGDVKRLPVLNPSGVETYSDRVRPWYHKPSVMSWIWCKRG